MKLPAGRSVRPTLRCLVEDLALELPTEVRDAARAAGRAMESDGLFLLPTHLAAIEHPLLNKANEVVALPASAREEIQVIGDRHVYKVKIGDRRGALWQDAPGVWWLLAAGRRKSDGSGDFYRELAVYAADSSPIAPTPRDDRYRLLEAGMVAETEAERAAHEKVLGAFLAAVFWIGEPQTVIVYGAEVTVTLRRFADVDALEVSWDLVDFDDQDRFPHDMLAMFPGLCSIDDWDYLPASADGIRPPLWFAYLPSELVDWYAANAEVHRLLGDETYEAPTPVTDGSEAFAHYMANDVATITYVMGYEVTGLCGARVIGHRDPQDHPVCPGCTEAKRALELRQQQT